MGELYLTLKNPNRPLKITVDRSEFIIGKNRALAHGVIDGAPAVSRTHCKIITQADGYYVVDMRSKNCTWLNSCYLMPDKMFKLKDGDLLRIADHEFEVTIVENITNPIVTNAETEIGDTIDLASWMGAQAAVEPPKPIKKDTKIYMVYSPIGGSGKTICALGICDNLAKEGKKVLYLNTETLQNYGYFVGEDGFADLEYTKKLACLFRKDNCVPAMMDSGLTVTESLDLEKDILCHIKTNNFDYFAPLEKAAFLYSISELDYMQLMDAIKDAGIYDYIFVDVSSEFSFNKQSWMEKVDKIFMICMQDENSVVKLQQLLKHISMFNSKITYICNRMQNKYENALSNMISLGEIEICEYIEETSFGELTLYDVRNMGLLKRAASTVES